MKFFGCGGFRHMAAALLLACSPCVTLGDVMTPAHVAKVRDVLAVSIHPDGERIAYLLSVPRVPFQDEDGPAYVQLMMVDRQGVTLPYVTGKETIGSIAWTPDGKHVSFLAKRGADKKKSLYVIPVAGGEARKVLEFGEDIGGYSWSPDGRRVAFLATEPSTKAQEELKAKGFTQQVYEEDVKQVKVWVATTGDLADVGANKDAAAGAPKMVAIDGSASELQWSPKGDALVFALAPTSLVDDGYMRKRVHVVHPDTGKILAKFENPGKLGAIGFNPEGTHVAFIAGEDIHDPHEGCLMVGSIADGQFRNVIPKYLGHVSAFVWKDKSTLIYIGDEGTQTVIGQVGADGKDRKSILAKGETIWTGLDLAKDGKTLALAGQSPTHPVEVFVHTIGAKTPRRLTTSNPWLSNIEFAKQEIVSYKARDGQELEGILIHPLKAPAAGTKVPLIVNVHGGPESHVRNGWMNRYAEPGHMAAAKGYAVFSPNYRGSTGRGVAFSKLGQGDPAGKEFDDLVDAVDHFVASGLADKTKVGITGGSYGGYASAWGATYYSDRFAASVMFVGISDKISKTGTTDIPDEEFYVHARQRPWKHWQFLLERSPIFHAEKGHTPILILHGKEDPRVFPGQSMELYRFLKVLNRAPVRLVFYPGEGHGNRRAASRYDYSLRMLQWFDHYLTGPGGPPPKYEIEYPR